MESLVAAVDALVVEDPHALADEPSLVELERQINRLQAVRARAVEAFDARQEVGHQRRPHRSGVAGGDDPHAGRGRQAPRAVGA